MQKEFNYTIVFITHDLGVVANIADRVAVVYAGQIIELASVDEIFYDPRLSLHMGIAIVHAAACGEEYKAVLHQWNTAFSVQ